MRALCSCFFSLFVLTLFLLPAETASGSDIRSFDHIFPGLPADTREAAFSSEGYTKSFEKAQISALAGFGRTAIAPKITECGFLIESILVIPGKADEYSLLDIYNALTKTRGLKGRVYYSDTRKAYVPLFEDVTRLESAKKNNPVADPAPAAQVPSSEIIYMRLRDVNFGNTYYRGDIERSQYGLSYTLSNNRSITYLFVPVIKEEKFIAQMYFEPISEGVLVYSVAGMDVSNFISSKVDMFSAVAKRLTVIMGWAVDGITDGANSATLLTNPSVLARLN